MRIIYKNNNRSNVFLVLNKELEIVSVNKKFKSKDLFYNRICEFYNNRKRYNISKTILVPKSINRLKREITYRYINGVSLQFIIENKIDFSIDFIDYLFEKSFSDILKLHANGLIHGDLSCDNILIEKSGDVNFIDCAFLSENDVKSDNVVITPNFLVPNKLYKQNPYIIDYYALAKSFQPLFNQNNRYYRFINDILSLKTTLNLDFLLQNNYKTINQELEVVIDNYVSKLYVEIGKNLFLKNRKEISYKLLIKAIEINKNCVEAIEFLSSNNFKNSNLKKYYIIAIFLIIGLIFFKINNSKTHTDSVDNSIKKFEDRQRLKNIKNPLLTTVKLDTNTKHNHIKTSVEIPFLKDGDSIYFNNIKVTKKSVKLNVGKYVVKYHQYKTTVELVPYMNNVITKVMLYEN